MDKEIKTTLAIYIQGLIIGALIIVIMLGVVI